MGSGADKLTRLPRDGRTKHPLYPTWKGMVQRCYLPSAGNYSRYGAKGIQVCHAWRADFWMFVEDMGPRPLGHTLDRINPHGNYAPHNCRWASLSSQQINQRKPKRGTVYRLRGNTARPWRAEINRNNHRIWQNFPTELAAREWLYNSLIREP